MITPIKPVYYKGLLQENMEHTRSRKSKKCINCINGQRKGDLMIYKILHRKLKIEKQEPTKNPGLTQVVLLH